jgi:branched-chain amino acid transport system substrate-binding protein
MKGYEMIRLQKTFAASAAALAVALACVASATAAGDPINLNVIIPLSGPGTFIGKSQQDALTAMETAVNKDGGIRGRPIHFIVHDDGSSPQNAVQAANQSLEGRPNVILGPSLAAMCLAVAPLVANGPVQYCFSPAIHPKAGSFTFSSSPSTAGFAVAFYRYFVSRGWKKVGLITSTDASGQDADEAFANALELPENKTAGLSVVDHEHFTVSDLSVSAQMERLKASGAQVIVCYAAGTPMGTLLQGVKQVGLDVPIATGNANMTYAQMKQYASFMPADLLFPGLPFLAHVAATPKAKVVQAQFYDSFKAMGIVPDVSQSTAWDPLLIVVDALRALGPDASAEQIRSYIAGLHGFVGIDGEYDFRDGSQRGLTEKNLIVMRWDPPKGTWTAVSGPGGGPLSGH